MAWSGKTIFIYDIHLETRVNHRCAQEAASRQRQRGAQRTGVSLCGQGREQQSGPWRRLRRRCRLKVMGSARRSPSIIHCQCSVMTFSIFLLWGPPGYMGKCTLMSQNNPAYLAYAQVTASLLPSSPLSSLPPPFFSLTLYHRSLSFSLPGVCGA